MKKIFLLTILAISLTNYCYSQTNATNFIEDDCNGVSHNLFDELDDGNIIVISWIMPCGPCATYSFPAYDAVQSFATSHPGKVHFYFADDYANSACGLLNNFANNYSMSNSTIFTSANITMSDYGVDGMPKVVVLGGNSHQIYLNKNDDKINYNNVHAAISTALNDLSLDIEDQKSNSFSLQIFPSPAQNISTISYSLQANEKINIELIDMLGKKIVLLDNQIQSKGQNNLTINTKKYLNGNYFIRIRSNINSQTINFSISN
tara:strand:- start:59 stop:844 length:786 start_codon:yes stop_codon:yes gene_type:complete